jgi:hypothetical protein
MKDKVYAGHRTPQGGGVEYAGVHKIDSAPFESPVISGAKIVEYLNRRALLQSQGEMASDEAGAASNQNSHRSSVSGLFTESRTPPQNLFGHV